MSNKNEDIADQIKCLQENLSLIRKTAQWTGKNLGEKTGLSRATIISLENGKTSMTLTQYIAIRAIIDYEIQTNKENTVLPKIVETFLDRKENPNPPNIIKISWMEELWKEK